MREFLKDVWMHGGEESRAITPENITGEKGRAAMSASHLGVGRKGSCCVPLESGETITLADIEGPGIIRHIWMTVPDKTAAGSFVMRDLVLRFYWDDEEFPTVTSTGAEDYFGGAWAFLDRPPHALPEAQCFNTLFAGYPYRSTRDATRDRFSAGKPNPNPMLATNDDALPRHGLYRWHLPDPISFKEDLRVTFQDLGNDDIKLYEREDDISTVAYWYQSEPHAVLAPFAARQDRVPR